LEDKENVPNVFMENISEAASAQEERHKDYGKVPK